MKKKLELKLKPISSSNSDNIRIYQLLNNSCEGLNSYLADFFETIEILKEKKMKGSADSKEVEESINFVMTKIDEVTSSMKNIAEEMHTLIELIES